MRLIDADWLSEVIHDNVPAPYENASWAKENCLAEIDAAPTIDAVPVVRCRECDHKDDENGRPYCLQLEMYLSKELDFFCKYGERKGNVLNDD